MEDTYFTLPIKVLASFNWVTRSIAEQTVKRNLESKIKWIMKIDSDVVVNWWNWEKLLLTQSGYFSRFPVSPSTDNLFVEKSRN